MQRVVDLTRIGDVFKWMSYEADICLVVLVSNR